jgi:hypothetical protein
MSAQRPFGLASKLLGVPLMMAADSQQNIITSSELRPKA